MEESLSRMFKNALEEDTPPSADAAIRAAIRRPRARHRLSWAAAAGLAMALGFGAWFYGRESPKPPAVADNERAVTSEEGEVMLEIIGMASVDDVYSLEVAQL